MSIQENIAEICPADCRSLCGVRAGPKGDHAGGRQQNE